MVFKFRTKCTLYLEHDDGEVSDVIPNIWSTQRWMKNKNDFTVIRKGSLFILNSNSDKVELINKNGVTIIFKEFKEILENGWFQLV